MNKKRKIGIIIIILLVLIGLYTAYYTPIKQERRYQEDFEMRISNLSKINVSILEPAKIDKSNYVVFEDYIINKEGKIINYVKDKRHITLLDNGDFLAETIIDKDVFGRYTWNGTVVWEIPVVIHHDISLTPKGTALTATKEVIVYNGRNIEFDVILEINTTTGEIISNYSFWDHFEEVKKYHKPSKFDQPSSVYIPLYPETNYSRKYPGDFDYYHLNSIEIIKENAYDSDTRFRQGNLIISLRTPDLVIIIDQDTKEIVWSYGPGELEGQHNPIMLPSGNIIIYDNGKPAGRNYTRIIEVNPITKEIEWEYKTNFLAAIVGTAQRLSNGNTLITHGTEGYVFEISPEGDKIWEMWTPSLNVNRSTLPNPFNFIYRAEVLDKEFVDSTIEKVKLTY